MLKKYFQLHKQKCFSLDFEILDFCCFYYSQLERYQTSQLDYKRFPKMLFAMVVLGMCLPYAKRYFQPFH